MVHELKRRRPPIKTALLVKVCEEICTCNVIRMTEKKLSYEVFVVTCHAHKLAHYLSIDSVVCQFLSLQRLCLIS